MTLTKYGWVQWLTITCVLVFIAAVAIYFHWWIAVAPLFLLWLALVSFFRNPWRTTPKNLPAGMMVSPADGVVSAIEYVDSHETVEGKAVIIRIFLSVLNVHINRTPCACTLTKAIYREGKFFDARSAESVKVNESNTLFFDFEGEGIGLRQVSGKIARNIVCPIQVGDSFTQGEQFGMIKFGSTTELILPRPSNVTVHVAKGDKVLGGLTKFATLATR
ncbi:MAG: phosphatidylserine decarboxylase family protein [Phycisphaerae bacterium]|nr:phosphatidylserine decarboxylase family protein [Phycisphaerae bacterium]MBT5409867.1 phosphatidylserine decarboxylase family protein [Phycisphaerae bacterium]